ncbi:unnamed protein product [Rhodiola kirilowii]
MAKPLEEETLAALTYKTWVLKVSIHCEGCNKKVKKVLQSIDGVYTTTVDSQQHKVHVTGNVEAETLIRKLLKAGKHATLWPEEPKKNNTEKPQKKGDLDDGSGEPGGEKTSEETNIKTDEVTANAKSSENNTEGEKTTEALGSDESSSVDKKSQSSEPVAAKNEGGNNASKKKKKKGKNSNSDKKEGGEKSSDSSPSDPADVVAAPPTKAPQTPPPVDLSPPNQHTYPSYVPMHYSPMAYTMSYNTAYSMPNASHYAPPAPASGGYVLLHPRSYAPQMLSDKACIQNEDSNDYGAGCSIM